MTFTLKTNTDLKSETITHELSVSENAATKWVMDTREESIRKALIDLGWTPPRAAVSAIE